MNLEVHIPYLLLPAPFSKMIANPQAPALEKLLARADRKLVNLADGYSSLAERWGMKPPYPAAAIFAQWDGFATGDSAWMFAEPVNLAPEQDWLKLAPARLLDVTADESAQLVGALNQHFSADGVHFSNREPGRWYVQCARKEIPDTTAVDAARLDPLIESQPVSKGAINWRALQNEAQMLFHVHPVNQSREAAGKPMINGIWFWGGGIAPVLTKPDIDFLFADTPPVLQLAKQTGIKTFPLDSSALKGLQGHALVVIDELSNLARDFDLLGWVGAVERLNQYWFAPISKLLSQGTIARLSIHATSSGQEQIFTLTRQQLLLRFWRSNRHLSSYA